MEQNVIALVEDVETVTRKRARVAAAIKKFRVTALVITACTKLSNGRGIRCDLELEGDFSDEPEQARSEIAREIIAVLSTQLSSARLDEEPLSEESLVASGHEGHCIAHPEAQGRMLPPPPTTDVGFLSNPTHDQQQRSETFEQAVGTMFTLPSDGPGFLSVHSRAQVTADREKTEQDEQGEWEMVDNLALTADDVSENIPNQWHPTREREESGQYEQLPQHMSPNAEKWSLDYLYEEHELACLNDMFPPIARPEGLVEDSLHVATTPISKEGDSIQRGINDQLLEQVDPNRQEQVDPNPQEQIDPTSQEQRGPSELSQPIPVLRELPSNIKREIEKTFETFDPASCRKKLLGVQSKVTENSNNLRQQLQDFSDSLGRLLNDLLNGVALSNVANPPTEQELARQHQQQELIRNFFQRIHNILWTPMRRLKKISENLDGLGNLLKDVGIETVELFQKCASSVCVTVESVLAKQAELHLGGPFH